MTKLTEFTLRRRVQFYETDMAGIVHFSRYLCYVEEAEHALWRAAGLSIAAADSEYGWPRVALTCEYRHPLRFEEEFDIHIRIVALTDRTMRYVCVLTRGTVTIATVTMTIACVRKSADGRLQAAPLPAAVRDRFEAAVDVA